MIQLRTPTYKRQNALLLMLKEAGGRLTRTDFQKLLFLVSEGQEEPYYAFVPYRYGSYSFQAASDLDTLQHQGWINLTSKDVSIKEGEILKTRLPAPEIAHIVDTLNQSKGLRGRRLVRYMYKKYPYYALNSEIAEEILNEDDHAVIKRQRKKLRRSKPVLFTIGYEGLKFESYVNRLIKNDVRLLCDVRQNPLSRKFGFSKGMLQTVLPKLGILYTHIPELGIVSNKRKGLSTSGEFTELFDEYRKELPDRNEALDQLIDLLSKHKRVAITCFEAHYSDCHRHCISDFLEARDQRVVEHL